MKFTSVRHRRVALGSLLLALVLALSGCGAANTPSPAATIFAPTVAPTALVTSTPMPTTAATPTLIPTLSPSPTTTEEPTPEPPPSATPRPQPSDDELIAACAKGTPIPGAAPYAGTLHPMVVVWSPNEGEWQVDDLGDVQPTIYDIDQKWFDNSWPSPIQLVACVDNGSSVKVGSCGTYTRQGGGESGELIRWKSAQTVRILVAKTGKRLQSQVYYGAILACPTDFQDMDSPPWDVYGPEPDDQAQINAYVSAVSTQKVK